MAGRAETAVVTVVLGALATLGWISGLFESLVTVHRESQPAEARPAVIGSPAPIARATQASRADTATATAIVASSGLVIPVAGILPNQLIDTFTQARAEGARQHDAIDIPAPLGTPVLAALAGTVERLYFSTAGGNTIYVRSPDRRLVFYYAHLDGYADGLAEGQSVQAGQVLGRVGFSGNANPAAPHLHFAILLTTPAARWHDPATAINPYPLLKGR